MLIHHASHAFCNQPALGAPVYGSSGRAPDLGALELGAIPPHYGPRP